MEIVSLGVLGSRRLDDERVAEAVRSAAEELGAARIVTAYETEGVCQAAREYAGEAGLALLLYPLPKGKGQGAHHWRNRAVIKASTRVLLVHDGEEDRQAAAELHEVRKSGKSWELLVLEPLPTRPVRPKPGELRVVRKGRTWRTRACGHSRRYSNKGQTT